MMLAGCTSGDGGTDRSAPAPTGDVKRGDLVFADDFDSEASIDRFARGGEAKWFTDLPFNWGPNSARLTVNESVLRVEQQDFTANWALSTLSPGRNAGQSFGHGYYEARMRFDPSLGPASPGWPAFWSLSSGHVRGGREHYAELDFFEAYTGGHAEYDRRFYGTIHDWQAGPTQGEAISSRSPLNTTVSDDKWHVYGCDWRPGRVRWFWDGALAGQQTFGDGTCWPACRGIAAASARPYPPLVQLDREPEGMAVILGSGPGWPLDIDWVRIWT